jgi:hypothetical protein
MTIEEHIVRGEKTGAIAEITIALVPLPERRPDKPVITEAKSRKSRPRTTKRVKAKKP